MEYLELKNATFKGFYELKDMGYPLDLILKIMLAECPTNGMKALVDSLFKEWEKELIEVDRIDLKDFL